jgi:hypothetical protein
MITRPGGQNPSYTIADIYTATKWYGEVKSRFRVKYMWNLYQIWSVVAETYSFNSYHLWSIIDFVHVDVTTV